MLPHALINNVEEKLGFKGEKLREYVRWLSDRILSKRTSARYHPTPHIDVYGTIGLIFDMDPLRHAQYIASLEKEAQGLPLYIEGLVDAGNKPGSNSPADRDYQRADAPRFRRENCGR